MNKILITGITGFVGSHLAEYILSLNGNYEIYGLSRWRSPKDNLEKIYKKVNIIQADLLDYSSLINTFRQHDFKFVFHLAAQSHVASSFKIPSQTLQTNIMGTFNLLEAIRLVGNKETVIHVCSSSSIYGNPKNDELITEDCTLSPTSPYAVSKIGEDMLALQYYLSYGLKTIRTRTFNHTGPRRGDIFVLSSFAKQIALLEIGEIKCIRHGNLESLRTFLDVRDIVRAYWLLVNKCQAGEVYNIGSMEAITIENVLNTLKSMSTVKDINTVSDKSLFRPSDVVTQRPNMDKFCNATNWRPEILFKKTCEDILNYWRNEVKNKPYSRLTIG